MSLRRGFLVFTSVLLTALIIDNTSKNNPVSSLAGVRVDAESDIPITYQGTGRSESSVFNPEYDLDAPSPKVQANAEPMGVNDIQTALAGLESKDLSKPHPQHVELKSAKDDMFDPSKDPDAPKPRLSALQRQELAETARANRMKAQLKIEAQLAMLTQRQQIRKNHRATKPVQDKSDPKEDTHDSAKSQHAVDPNSVAKPSFRSISEEVRDSLDKGLDPSKIITKELQSEMQYESKVHTSAGSDVADAIAEAGRLSAHP